MASESSDDHLGILGSLQPSYPFYDQPSKKSGEIPNIAFRCQIIFFILPNIFWFWKWFYNWESSSRHTIFFVRLLVVTTLRRPGEEGRINSDKWAQLQTVCFVWLEQSVAINIRADNIILGMTFISSIWYIFHGFNGIECLPSTEQLRIAICSIPFC